jgi:hypothetical protein
VVEQLAAELAGRDAGRQTQRGRKPRDFDAISDPEHHPPCWCSKAAGKWTESWALSQSEILRRVERMIA